MTLFGYRIGKADIVFLHDLIMTVAGFVLALALRVGSGLPEYFETIAFFSPVLVLVAAVTYLWSGLYRGIWRYASVSDMVQLIKAVTLLIFLFFGTVFLIDRLSTIPRSVPLIQWFVLIILLAAPRFAYRLYRDQRLGLVTRRRRGGESHPILLIGAGDGAELLLRALASGRYGTYDAVGVIDIHGRRVGRSIHRTPVIGAIDDLPRVIARCRRPPERIILTARLPAERVREIMDRTASLGVPVSRLPSLTDFRHGLDEGRVEFRPISLNDLLRRPPARLDLSAMNDLIRGRRVLITGAGGTIGGELTCQIAGLAPSHLVLVEASEFNLYEIDRRVRSREGGGEVVSRLLDIRAHSRLDALFREFRPEVVFHAAALKHVPLVEANPVEAAATNVLGTRNVANAAAAHGVHAFVLISTDKAIRPSSIMGATKRLAEIYCQTRDLTPGADSADGVRTRFMTVRFGNVLGSSGSVVPLFQEQIAAGGPVTVTHAEMRRYFMTVNEAIQLVLQAAAYGLKHEDLRGRVFVLDMGEPVRIADLARQMIRLAGHQPDADIAIRFTGVRPGEKLYEELLDPEEHPVPTEADGVITVTPRLFDAALLDRALRELETAVGVADEDKVRAILGNLVPGYRPAVASPAPAAVPVSG